MRVFTALFMVLSLFLLSTTGARAQTLRIRAVLANPSAAEETEWIAVENTGAASVSATFVSLRDTHGSVKSYQLSGMWSPKEIVVFPRTISGITLNNDKEGVELLEAGQVIQSVPELTSPGNDQVWMELSGEWRYVSLSEWQNRLQSKNWIADPVQPDPSPTPTTTAPAELQLSLVSPCTSPEWIEVKALSSGRVSELRVEDSSGSILRLEDLEFSAQESRRLEWAGAKLSNTGEWLRVIFPNKEELFSYEACSGSLPYLFSDGKWQQSELGQENSVISEGETEATTSAESIPENEAESKLFYSARLPRLIENVGAVDQPRNTKFPDPPLPDFEEEEQLFLDWKQGTLIGSLALVLAGCCGLLLTLPELLAWYNEHQDPW